MTRRQFSRYLPIYLLISYGSLFCECLFSSSYYYYYFCCCTLFQRGVLVLIHRNMLWVYIFVFIIYIFFCFLFHFFHSICGMLFLFLSSASLFASRYITEMRTRWRQMNSFNVFEGVEKSSKRWNTYVQHGGPQNICIWEKVALFGFNIHLHKKKPFSNDRNLVHTLFVRLFFHRIIAWQKILLQFSFLCEGKIQIKKKKWEKPRGSWGFASFELQM